MTTTAETDDRPRLGSGTVHDLPTPWTRACATAMLVGVVVELETGFRDGCGLQACWVLRGEPDSIRDVCMIEDSLSDDDKAAALAFVLAVVGYNRAGGSVAGIADFNEDEGFGYMGVTGHRETATDYPPGYKKLALAMGREIGLTEPAVFETAT